MTQWFVFAAVCAGIGIIGVLLWEDIGRWFDQEPPCTCRKGKRCLACIERDGLTRRAA